MNIQKIKLSKLRKSDAGFTLIELLIVAAMFATTALLSTTVFTNVLSRQRQIQGTQRVNVDGRYVVETIARSIRTQSFNYAQFTDSVVPSNPSIISTVNQNGDVTCYRKNGTAVQVATNAALDCNTPPPTWTTFTPDDLQVVALNFYVSPSSDPWRLIPRSIADCKITPQVDGTFTSVIVEGFDPSLGSCMCVSSNIIADCYSNTCTPTSPAEFTCATGVNQGKACTVLTQVLDCLGTNACTQSGPARSICTNPNIQPHVTIYLSTSTLSSNPGEQSNSVIQTTVTSRVYR